ncbi:unnamed protein product [Clonostachys rhizophaga]|uniref:Lysophospholipase n=1 Tax=Clonostachys rhizophaga TaxID=160324 RepID=A0A9N9VDA6_9HYPO|nr:unnamed protein product [Clonostachys rhizophaga]
MWSDNLSSLTGRSETFEQRQYEEELAKKLKKKPYIIGPTPIREQFHEQFREDELEETQPQDLEAGGHSTGGDQHGKKKRKRVFFWRKWRAFWEKVIKPAFPEAVTDMKILFGTAALKARLNWESTNATLHPEIASVAQVRRGLELCPEEQRFLRNRRELMRLAFANYLGLDPNDVHPDDVPVISFGGSGGGFRALIGCLGYMAAMKQHGLWDCLAYTSGVSGSCWALGIYYTIANCNIQAAIEHCKARFYPYHPLSSDAIRAILSTQNGAKITLGPLIQKHKSGIETHSMDWYSTFTTGYIFFQGEAKLEIGRIRERDASTSQTKWLKYSDVGRHTDNGHEPLPIMTAIRHERLSDRAKHGSSSDNAELAGSSSDSETPNSWYQWFELTPYEIGCDEIEAWVPTWAFGRPFSHGKSTVQLPEQSLALILGLATSAPAAHLASYLSTINRNLSYGLFGTSIREIARTIRWWWGERGTEQFENHHPLHACEEHNYMYRYTEDGQDKKKLSGLETSRTIELIDSGMDNNCPTYVLLHPARGVDIIMNMDASSDVLNDTFQERVDQIGSRKGMKFTKRDIAHDSPTTEEVEKGLAAEASIPAEWQENIPEEASKGAKIEKAEIETVNPYKGKYAQIYDGVPTERPATVVNSYGKTVTNPPSPVFTKESTMIYMPIIPNEEAVKDFNPSTAKFSGSYNLVWTAEQINMLLDLSRANFAAGEDAIKTAMMEAWQRNKTRREELQLTRSDLE